MERRNSEIGHPPEKGRTCATMDVHRRYLELYPGYRENLGRIEDFTRNYVRNYFAAGLRDGIVKIPVVVHVVYNTAAQNISDAQIQSQIAILNNDYRMLNSDIGVTPAVFQTLAADARIEFGLAVRDPNCNATNGITRTNTATPSFTLNDAVKANATGGQDPWPRDSYLNLWVCNLSGNLLGYATFPGGPANLDGVVITYTAFGNIGTATAPFALGRTASHEIGHWFNLHHIWGDAVPCGDDFVADTPTQYGPNVGCPAFPHISAAPCANGPNGDLFVDYMDYVDDDCMVMFSAGQVARMNAALSGPRAAILGSAGLTPPPAALAGVLWSQDTPVDVGAEPDILSPVMYESDDIWVRNINDGFVNQDHQNPIYRLPGTGSNYVYVRIRNLGCNSTSGGTVKLYWAKASLNLSWPAPWDGSVLVPALMGGMIGSLPSGTIPGGGAGILEYPWYPPNPNDYASFGADQSHFCLLSRIETSPNPPYGMTFPEGANLYANVENNNKIVWKNISVIGPAGPRLAAVTIGNLGPDSPPFRLVFAIPGSEKRLPKFGLPRFLLEWTNVEVHLGRRLFEAWKMGGSKSAGIEPAGKDSVFITSPQAWIDNISLKPHELHTIEVRFRPKHEEVGHNVFHLQITQQVAGHAGKVVGGQLISLKTSGGTKPKDKDED